MPNSKNKDFMYLEEDDDFSLSEYFCKIVINLYRRIDVLNYQYIDDYNNKLNSKFKINNEHTHQIIEASCWSIEDSELIIKEFSEYGIEGITKLRSNLGERYLRLYGFLQAVHNQRSALIKLCEIFYFPNWKDLKNEFRSLLIVEARHMISSHSLDYEGPNGEVDFYKLVQSGLSTNSIQIVGGESHYDINLKIELRKFYLHIYPKYFLLLKHIQRRFFVESSHDFKNMGLSISIFEKRMRGFGLVNPDDVNGVINMG